MRSAMAFAPASIGNVAVGFDVLGQAISGAGDRCTATVVQTQEVRIRSISGLSSALPVDPQANTAGRAVLSLLDSAKPGFGVELSIEKGIPLGSGMGGSAASAVAGVVAANALLPRSLDTDELLQHAMRGEALASGAVPHADNIAPSLYGGLTLVTGKTEVVVTRLPVPDDMVSILVYPHIRLDTRAGREILSSALPMPAVIEQLAAMAGFVSACYRNDHVLLAQTLKDGLIEPQRQH
ncbi:MAG: homoserine kinase, partial [Gammaproteobacteria bacterium]|nr:homoserine kinase [Gammaproteobacteria bacterium]